jgi:hypothetical protein
VVPTARQLAREEQDMREEDEYYQAMFRDSIIWSVAIVVAFALFALLA